jgi:prophage antirepressor-like protein
MNSEIALSRQWFTAKDIAKEIGRETHSAQTYVRGLADDERLETSREGGSAVKYRVRRTDKEIAVLRTSWRTFDNSELDLPSRLGAPW